MSHETAVPHAATDQQAPAVERLAALIPALADDLDRGVWSPGPLERLLAARLLLACAGDRQFTPVRVQETLRDGNVALTYAGEGRLAGLLALILEVTTHSAPEADPALADASRLLERVALDKPGDGGEL